MSQQTHNSYNKIIKSPVFELSILRIFLLFFLIWITSTTFLFPVTAKILWSHNLRVINQPAIFLFLNLSLNFSVLSALSRLKFINFIVKCSRRLFCGDDDAIFFCCVEILVEGSWFDWNLDFIVVIIFRNAWLDVRSIYCHFWMVICGFLLRAVDFWTE